MSAFSSGEAEAEAARTEDLIRLKRLMSFVGVPRTFSAGFKSNPRRGPHVRDSFSAARTVETRGKAISKRKSRATGERGTGPGRNMT